MTRQYEYKSYPIVHDDNHSVVTEICNQESLTGWRFIRLGIPSKDRTISNIYFEREIPVQRKRKTS